MNNESLEIEELKSKLRALRDAERAAREAKKVIEEKAVEELKKIESGTADKKLIEKAEEQEWLDVDKDVKTSPTWLRLYKLLPRLIVENEKVKAAELDYEAAVETLKKSYSAYYPQVTTTYGSNWEDDRTPSKSSTVGVDSIKNDGKHGIQKSITITQMIWDFGRTSSLIDM